MDLTGVGGARRSPSPPSWVTWAAWIVAMVVAAAQCWAAFARPLHDRLADLHVYVGSVSLLREGGSLYDFAAEPTGAPFTYPPFAGLLFLPLTLVSEPALRVVWTTATVMVIALIAVVVARAADPHLLPARLAAAVLTAVLFASAPASSNLRFGQVSVFLALLVLVDCLRLVPERFAGIATGFAGAVKLTPLIFIPYLWFTGRRRAALTAAATFGGCALLAWLVLPGESARFWLTEIWNVDRVGNISTGGNQSLNGMLLRLAVPDTARTALVGVIGLAVAVWALVRAVRADRAGAPLAGAVVVGAASLVVSPVSWTHHQIWLVLAAWVAVSASAARNAAWSGLVVALMALPVTSVGAHLPGGVVWGNARLLLALAIACAVPFVARRAAAPEPAPRPVPVPGPRRPAGSRSRRG